MGRHTGEENTEHRETSLTFPPREGGGVGALEVSRGRDPGRKASRMARSRTDGGAGRSGGHGGAGNPDSHGGSGDSGGHGGSASEAAAPAPAPTTGALLTLP